MIREKAVSRPRLLTVAVCSLFVLLAGQAHLYGSSTTATSQAIRRVPAHAGADQRIAAQGALHEAQHPALLGSRVRTPAARMLEGV